MAPPPEYDKEPKAPDKSSTILSNEDSKLLLNINDQQIIPDQKTADTATNNEIENVKSEKDSVENLDDGRLRALLDEAITYKCPKDREGKSDLFKNLLEQAEQQDESAPAGAAGASSSVGVRGLSTGRGARARGGRRALPHSNSLQDLVAALAAEPAPRRARHAHSHAHAHHAATAPVSARATQGGSLPSGVDTSFREEPAGTRAGYLATVRCVNPPPLAERRVSTSDANPPVDESLPRRSKPAFPMTYTARATLEIGSGSVCSGRAVTTTTASNQSHTNVIPKRSSSSLQSNKNVVFTKTSTNTPQTRTEITPKEGIDSPQSGAAEITKRKKTVSFRNQTSLIIRRSTNSTQTHTHSSNIIGNNKGNANSPQSRTDVITARNSGTTNIVSKKKKNSPQVVDNKRNIDFDKKHINVNNYTTINNNNHPDSPQCNSDIVLTKIDRDIHQNHRNTNYSETEVNVIAKTITDAKVCVDDVDRWYEGLATYYAQFQQRCEDFHVKTDSIDLTVTNQNKCDTKSCTQTSNIVRSTYESVDGHLTHEDPFYETNNTNSDKAISSSSQNTKSKRTYFDEDVLNRYRDLESRVDPSVEYPNKYYSVAQHLSDSKDESDIRELRKMYRKRVGGYLEKPSLSSINPKNIRPMTISSIPTTSCDILPSNVTPHDINKDIKTNMNCKKSELKKTDECNFKEKSYHKTCDFTKIKSNNNSLPRHLKDSKFDETMHENQKCCVVSKILSYKCTENNKKLNNNEEELVDIVKESKNDTVTQCDSVQLGTETCELCDVPKNCQGNNKKLILQEKKLLDIAEEVESDTWEQNNADRETVTEHTEPCHVPKTCVNKKREENKINFNISSNDIQLIDIVEGTKNDTLPQFDSVHDEIPCDISTVSKCTENIKKVNNNDIELVDIVIDDNSDTLSETNSVHRQFIEALGARDTDYNCNDCKETELVDINCNTEHSSTKNSFIKYCAHQQQLMEALKDDNCDEECTPLNITNINDGETVKEDNTKLEMNSYQKDISFTEDADSKDLVVQLNKAEDENIYSNQYVIAELPNNAYVFLTLPKRLITPVHKNNEQTHKLEEDTLSKKEMQSIAKNSKKKKEKSAGISNAKLKENLNKTALKLLLFENVKSDSVKTAPSVVAVDKNKEIDSAISFSCITTPEVVASCNTTSSTSSAVAIDPKPLQLGSCYRAVASLTGAAAAASPSAAADTAAAAALLQPRSVISSSFNGFSLSRPNYGSVSSAATEEYKGVPIFTVHYRSQKSLDENGNAVQGFSSPVSASGQHKKPRRKKSSKNETVITSHQIDGYQGNKDLNEVLRFIESNAEHGRGGKLPRAKHRDDADDKGKKRGPERRKEREPEAKRASSLEELSRTTLEELTQPAADGGKPERRSWGDDARGYYESAPVHAEPPPAPAELTDFQTVTKRRRARRRPDERARPPSPSASSAPRARRESAPPSDRSNDSNDDLDSVHSLPAHRPPPPPPPPPPPLPPPPSVPAAPAPVTVIAAAAAAAAASYADIARTRHNIPDLIESCNFYAEGEPPAASRGGAADSPPSNGGAGDADGGYPALGGAAAGAAAPAGGTGPRGARGKPPPRRAKERAGGGVAVGALAGVAVAAEPPAPDVVADRRPAVILVEMGGGGGDMEGVTFGFDINEQLVGARRGGGGGEAGSGAGCDLVREAEGAVAVRAGGAALRYLPPPPAQHRHHLHLVVDYVAQAWEDVMRCGGKVRYYAE